jgi:hypothetical protein
LNALSVFLICWIWSDPTFVKLAKTICLWSPKSSYNFVIVRLFLALT